MIRYEGGFVFGKRLGFNFKFQINLVYRVSGRLVSWGYVVRYCFKSKNEIVFDFIYKFSGN